MIKKHKAEIAHLTVEFMTTADDKRLYAGGYLTTKNGKPKSKDGTGKNGKGRTIVTSVKNDPKQQLGTKIKAFLKILNKEVPQNIKEKGLEISLRDRALIAILERKNYSDRLLENEETSSLIRAWIKTRNANQISFTFEPLNELGTKAEDAIYEAMEKAANEEPKGQDPAPS